MSKNKRRLDALLLEKGLASHLAEAQGLIMAGQVLVAEQRVDKPSTLVQSDLTIRVRDRRRFVSRGGEKLWGVVEDFVLASKFVDAVVLDCGASTGGFTDCALQLGAKKVYAVDVGTNQLAWKLRTDPRVVVQEQTDIRQLTTAIDPAIGLALADISFNSLDRLLPALVRAVRRPGVDFILLVKPQFELGTEDVPEGGVVAEESDRQKALERVLVALEREGLKFHKSSESRVAGRNGNREIFVWASLPEPG